MLKKLLATTALCTIPFASYAADLPVKARPIPVPVYNWNGFYVGGNIGYSWGHWDTTGDVLDVSGFGTGIGAAQRLNPNGVIGGVQAGYNWQQSRNWVWGLETDFQWSGQKSSAASSASFAVFDVPASGDLLTGSASAAVSSKLTWLGTARGRLGYVADGSPGTLWYGTGGLAYGRVKTLIPTGTAAGTFVNSSNCEGGCAFSGSAVASASQVKVGWTLGAGVEGDLANLWTWKVEYLYVDLGKVTGTVPVFATACFDGSCGSTTGTATFSNRMTDNIIRIGFNRKFGP